MNLIARFFKWLEVENSFGKIIKDYGIISERPILAGCEQTSILLCRHKGELQIVIQTMSVGSTSTRTWCKCLPVSSAPQMREIMADIEFLGAEV